jgi:hypothetical protein
LVHRVFKVFKGQLVQLVLLEQLVPQGLEVQLERLEQQVLRGSKVFVV